MAYDLYLQSQPAPDRGHVPLHQAIAILEEAVGLASDFAPAWAVLAAPPREAHRHLTLDPLSPQVQRTAVLLAAERALQLDPHAGPAHAALAHLLPWVAYSRRAKPLSRKAELADPSRSGAVLEMDGFFTLSGGARKRSPVQTMP